MVQEEHGFTISKTEIYSKEEESAQLVEWSSTQLLVRKKVSLVFVGIETFPWLKTWNAPAILTERVKLSPAYCDATGVPAERILNFLVLKF